MTYLVVDLFVGLWKLNILFKNVSFFLQLHGLAPIIEGSRHKYLASGMGPESRVSLQSRTVQDFEFFKQDNSSSPATWVAPPRVMLDIVDHETYHRNTKLPMTVFFERSCEVLHKCPFGFLPSRVCHGCCVDELFLNFVGYDVEYQAVPDQWNLMRQIR